MINFEDLKAKIAEIASTKELKVEATDVTIGFTKRAYEIEITKAGVELSKKNIADIVTALGEAVVKTIAFVSGSENSVIVVFDMNYMN